MYKNSKYIYGLLKHFPDKFQRICCSCCCWSRNCDSIFCLRKGFMYKSHANLYHLFSLKSLYAFGSDLFASNQQEWNGIVSMKYIFSKQDNGENEKELLFRSLYSRYIFCVWEEKWYLEWKSDIMILILRKRKKRKMSMQIANLFRFVFEPSFTLMVSCLHVFLSHEWSLSWVWVREWIGAQNG